MYNFFIFISSIVIVSTHLVDRQFVEIKIICSSPLNPRHLFFSKSSKINAARSIPKLRHTRGTETERNSFVTIFIRFIRSLTGGEF